MLFFPILGRNLIARQKKNKVPFQGFGKNTRLLSLNLFWVFWDLTFVFPDLTDKFTLFIVPVHNCKGYQAGAEGKSQ